MNKFRVGDIIVVNSFDDTKDHFGASKRMQNMIGKEYKIEESDHDSVVIHGDYWSYKDLSFPPGSVNVKLETMPKETFNHNLLDL